VVKRAKCEEASRILTFLDFPSNICIAHGQRESGMKSDTQQLNVEIDAKLLSDLEDVKQRTKVSKRALVEQAIRILVDQYRSMAAVYKNGVVDAQFIAMVDQTMRQYNQAMKKLVR